MRHLEDLTSTMTEGLQWYPGTAAGIIACRLVERTTTQPEAPHPYAAVIPEIHSGPQEHVISMAPVINMEGVE